MAVAFAVLVLVTRVVAFLVVLDFAVVVFVAALVLVVFAVVTGAVVGAEVPSQVGNLASLPWVPLQLALVSSFELDPLPLFTPLYSAQTFLVVPHEPLMDAVSPKLLLMPTRSEVTPKARTFSTMTLRGLFASLLVQSPHER